MQIHELHPIVSTRLMVVGTHSELRAAALLLSHPGIGLVVVCDGNGFGAGVVSKSDLVRHLATSKSNDATVTALMSQPIVCCSHDDDLHSVWELMTTRNLQNIPVLGPDSRPIGILDIRDALKALFEQEEIEEQMLSNYIAGIGYQ
jgi:CBS domain-containing protein